jgi:chemotaxis regulatin CheY-phosphate phosphatase CheZ
MARYQQGEKEQAHQLLTEAAKPLQSLMENSSANYTTGTSDWVDWMNAHIMLKEAKETINGQ